MHHFVHRITGTACEECVSYLRRLYHKTRLRTLALGAPLLYVSHGTQSGPRHEAKLLP